MNQESKAKLTEAQALKRLAAYCSKAERCSYDVRRKLIALNLENEVISRIIDRLIKEKFLDEKRFCRSFINDKMRFNKWGETKINYELRKRNIAENVYLPILKDLSGDGFEEQLINLLKAKITTIKAKTEYDRRNKLIRFALGRGFKMDMTVRCVNKLLGNVPEEDF